MCEAVPMEAAEKYVNEPLVSHCIAGRLQYLNPEDIVPERTQAEKVLQEAAPMSATLWIARQ